MKPSSTTELDPLHRLHPISMIFFVAKTSKELYGFLPGIPVLAVALNRFLPWSISTWWLSVLVVAWVLGLVIVLSWYRWRRFGYRIQNKAIYIEHGLWVKSKMWIFHDRIQSLNTTQALYDRVFGLLRLQLETAGGEKPEMVLSSITATEANRISRELGFGAVTIDQPDSVAAYGTDVKLGVIKKITLSELVIHSMMPDKYIYAFVFFTGVFFNLGGEALTQSQIWSQLQDRLGFAWIGLLFGAFMLVSWLIAFLLKFVDHYNFTLERSGNKLTTHRGLWERKQSTVALERIQALLLVEHLLYKRLGYVTLRAVTAGNTEKHEKTITLFPIVRKEDIASMLHSHIPPFTVHETWNSVEPKTIRQFVVFPVLLSSAIVIPAVLFIPWNIGWLTMLLPILVFASGWMEYKQTAWSISDQHVALRYGAFSRQRAIIPKRRIQWHQMSQTPFQQRQQLANLEIWLAAGNDAARFTLQHASLQNVQRLMNELARR